MKITTVKEHIFWSYANLAMAHSAITQNRDKYSTLNYMIRARLYKGLMTGTMNIASIVDDEKIKIKQGTTCSYCHSTADITADHLIPKYRGGENSAENIVCACKSCNSSKGKKDLLEWYAYKNEFPPLMLLRRYLKLLHNFSEEHNILDIEIEALDNSTIPFRIDLIPYDYPNPSELKL